MPFMGLGPHHVIRILEAKFIINPASFNFGKPSRLKFVPTLGNNGKDSFSHPYPFKCKYSILVNPTIKSKSVVFPWSARLLTLSGFKNANIVVGVSNWASLTSDKLTQLLSEDKSVRFRHSWIEICLRFNNWSTGLKESKDWVDNNCWRIYSQIMPLHFLILGHHSDKRKSN